LKEGLSSERQRRKNSRKRRLRRKTMTISRRIWNPHHRYYVTTGDIRTDNPAMDKQQVVDLLFVFSSF
jgi:hypothetical protein